MSDAYDARNARAEKRNTGRATRRAFKKIATIGVGTDSEDSEEGIFSEDDNDLIDIPSSGDGWSFKP